MDVAVVELSSFQLISMRKSPDRAAITNIYPDHLNVHSSMQEYIDAKRNILLYQSAQSRTVLGWENDVTRRMENDVRGSLRWFTRLSPVSEGACLDEENRLCRRVSHYYDTTQAEPKPIYYNATNPPRPYTMAEYFTGQRPCRNSVL